MPHIVLDAGGATWCAVNVACGSQAVADSAVFFARRKASLRARLERCVDAAPPPPAVVVRDTQIDRDWCTLNFFSASSHVYLFNYVAPERRLIAVGLIAYADVVAAASGAAGPRTLRVPYPAAARAARPFALLWGPEIGAPISAAAGRLAALLPPVDGSGAGGVDEGAAAACVDALERGGAAAHAVSGRAVFALVVCCFGRENEEARRWALQQYAAAVRAAAAPLGAAELAAALRAAGRLVDDGDAAEARDGLDLRRLVRRSAGGRESFFVLCRQQQRPQDGGAAAAAAEMEFVVDFEAATGALAGGRAALREGRATLDAAALVEHVLGDSIIRELMAAAAAAAPWADRVARRLRDAAVRARAVRRAASFAGPTFVEQQQQQAGVDIEEAVAGCGPACMRRAHERLAGGPPHHLRHRERSEYATALLRAGFAPDAITDYWRRHFLRDGRTTPARFDAEYAPIIASWAAKASPPSSSSGAAPAAPPGFGCAAMVKGAVERRCADGEGGCPFAAQAAGNADEARRLCTEDLRARHPTARVLYDVRTPWGYMERAASSQ